MKYLLCVFCILMSLAPGFALAQSVQADDGLLARQQLRLDRLENDMRDLRGSLETEMRAIRQELEKIATSALESSSARQAGNRQLLEQLAGLEDSISMLESRFKRSLEISSDLEFRVLRLEKRLQTLLALSTDPQGAANRMVQQDTTAGGAAPQVSMKRDPDTGETSWSINQNELDKQLRIVQSENAAEAMQPAAGDTNTQPGQAGQTQLADSSTGSLAAAVTDQPARLTEGTAPQAAGQAPLQGTDQAATAANSAGQMATGQNLVEAPQEAAPAGPVVLPDLSPEEQYRYALGRALQNDLETAEAAFDEFRQLHPDHSRSADALFWLGRVQYMRGRYEKAAMSFTEFNAAYPGDSRMVDTTLWIAEAVAQFAEAEQACAIFASLPQLLDNPPESFVSRLAELNASANCES